MGRAPQILVLALLRLSWAQLFSEQAEVVADVTPAQPPVPLAWTGQVCNSNDGETGSLHIKGLEGGTFAMGRGGTVSGAKLTMRHNAGYSLMSTCRKDWAPEEYVQLQLIGRSISFEVDLSKVGCACNLGFYLTAAAAVDEEGAPSRGECEESPYYCDAYKVCGQWCPEIDIMEASNHVFRATPHSCDEPNERGHYSSCDRNGCSQSTRDMPGMYGLGAEFTIDTRFAFNVSTRFSGEEGVLTGMVTTLQQQGRVVYMSHSNCEPEYLAKVGKALSRGMSLRTTYWGSDAQAMAYMDNGICGVEICDGSNAGEGTFSGISIDPPQIGVPTRPIPTFRPLPSAQAPAISAHSSPEQMIVDQVTEWWPIISTALGAILLTYPLAIVLVWCFPSLVPNMGYSAAVTRSDSALYASRASSRRLFARESTLHYAADEVNRILRRICCCCCCCRSKKVAEAKSQAHSEAEGQA